MSIRTTVTCDECNDDEEVDIGWHGPELPEGWIVNPDDDEQHFCEYCAEEKGLAPVQQVVDHVMRTDYWRKSPVGFIFTCHICRADIWQRDYYYTTPKTCNVCNHLNGPKLLTGGHE